MKKIIKQILKYYGYEIRKPNLRDDHFKRRMALIKTYGINKILDVGANSGQYGKLMRKNGFKGDIVSFEPLSNVFKLLTSNIFKDSSWIALNYALGRFDGEAIINVSRNSESSSIFQILPSHLAYRPSSEFISKENIEIHKLDTIIDSVIKPDDVVLLKIDAQGYEHNILEGATNSLAWIKAIQIEMSLEPLYDGEKFMCELIKYLSDRNFKLMSIEPGSVDYNTGQMFQVDGIFIKV